MEAGRVKVQGQAFEQMNWHDNHVHALAIDAGENGTGELVLDIDHITEWLCGEGNSFAFMVVPSTLTFHEVFNLAIAINYATPSIAIGPFSIHQVHRESIQYSNGYSSFKWRIELNCPNGEITFEAPGFSQSARGKPVRSEKQFMSAEERSQNPPNISLPNY